jgi:hypothetical protein
MTDHGTRTGAARDVPPPRPVDAADPAGPEDAGLSRAGRAVADAVAGLLGDRGGRAGEDAAPRPAGGGLRDVVGAVASAVAGAFDGRGAPSGERAQPRPGGDRTPAALLGDLLAAAAPRLPIRDGDRLRRAHPGATDEEIAGALVARSARLTAAVGAATGGLVAAHWFAPPSLLALPLELGAETVLVAGVELVLIGELHELHGKAAPGDARGRASAYLTSWSTQRAATGLGVPGTGATGLGAVLNGAAVRGLTRRLTRRMTRGVPVAAPFLIGAALAGRGNRRATETLAARVLADLRGTRALGPGRESR